MSASSITTIPKLSQLAIFDKLPLHRLLHIDEVCRAWGEDMKLAALARRKELVIVQNKKDLKNLKLPPFTDSSLFRLVKEDDGSPYKGLRLGLDHHALILKDLLTLPTMAMLTWCLPNLKVIRIVQDEVNFSMLLSISSLLDRYRHKLTELTVKVYFNDILPKDVVKKNEAQTAASNFFNSFCQSLNSLTALTSLELHLNAEHYVLQLPLAVLAKAPDLAAVIGRVKYLCLRLDCFEENPYHGQSGTLLCQYIRANKHLNSFYCSNMDSDSPHRSFVTAAWQKVSFHYFSSFHEAVALHTLPQYSSLLELDVTYDIDYSSMLLLMRTLATSGACHSLIHLNFWEIGFQSEDQYLSKCHLPVLPSVKVLSLYCVLAPNHQTIEQWRLATIFPNVQVIGLEQDYTLCEDCDYNLDEYMYEGNSRKKIRERRALVRTIHNCLRQSRLCFDRFAKLTRLEVDYKSNARHSEPENFSPSLNRHWSFTKENLNQNTLLPSETDGWEVEEFDDDESDGSDSDMTIDDE